VPVPFRGRPLDVPPLSAARGALSSGPRQAPCPWSRSDSRRWSGC